MDSVIGLKEHTKMERRLFVFTVKYPYSDTAECFLEDEVPYLANQFDKVLFLPLKREGTPQKELPNNCNSVKPIFGGILAFALRGMYNRKGSGCLIKDFFENRVYCSKRKFRVWIIGYFSINNLLNSRQLKRVRANLNPSDVCYFYWGKWSNALSYFWKGEAHFVSRFHGHGDLWEQDYDEYFPLRKSVVPCLDIAAFISPKGQDYYTTKYTMKKPIVVPLGSFDNTVVLRSKDGILRVVSCSTVYSIKRVPLIFESLKIVSENTTVEWTHIGGGPQFEYLREIVAASADNPRLKVNLLGMITHSDVVAYYSTHAFDVFVNLSSIEGVPVSIMEAISCNIPIVATNVGSTSDIVNEHTGVLIDANPTPQCVADAIISISKSEISPRQYWENHYNADVNYRRFADILYSLEN